MKSLLLLAFVVAVSTGCAVRASVPGASFAIDGRGRAGGYYRRSDYRRPAFAAPVYVRRPRCNDGY